MRVALVFNLILVLSFPVYAKLSSDWSYVEKRLKKAGLKKDFIAAVQSTYDDKDIETVIKLNVLLFLKKANYHAVQVSDNGAENIRSFLEVHKDIFAKTEKDFGVGPAVIASLLWMETRHGANYGRFHVASVFVNLLQAERSESLTFLQENAASFDANVSKKNRREIERRTKIKSKWALQELKSLQWLYQKDPEKFKTLYGSFSGAFGMPQFLPTSYKAYAKTTKKNSAPDLFTADDSIYSVGNYLKKHGWKQQKPKGHTRSLMRYNNSRDYAEAILRLASMMEK